MLMTSWPIDPLTVSGALARCVIEAFDQVSGLASVGQDADLMRLVGQVELAYDAGPESIPIRPTQPVGHLRFSGHQGVPFLPAI